MNKNALIRGALIGALLAAPAAHADQLAPGLGGGNQRTRGDAIVRAYHKDAAPLWGFDGRVEFTLASWNGGDRNDVLGVARSLRRTLGEKGYVSASLGLGYVSRSSDHLGGHGQFTLRVALGRRLGRYDLSLAQQHYSNGGTARPNTGENFLVLALRREF